MKNELKNITDNLEQIISKIDHQLGSDELSDIKYQLDMLRKLV